MQNFKFTVKSSWPLTMANREKRANIQPKSYNGGCMDEDDDMVVKGYVIEDKINQEHYSKNLVKVMEDGSSMTFEYFQEHGFDTPLHFKSVEGLG